MPKDQLSFEENQLIERIDNEFKHHTPFADQSQRYDQVRAACGDLAKKLITEIQCPYSRELSVALTKLREVMFWANAAIACNEKPS